MREHTKGLLEFENHGGLLIGRRGSAGTARLSMMRRHPVVTRDELRQTWLPACALTIVTLICPLRLVAGPAPPLPPDKQVIAKLLAIAGDGFRTRETDHFTIAYDTSYEAVRPLVGRLEGTFDAVWRFCEANELAGNGLAARLEVLLFDKFEDYTRYGTRVGVSAETMAGFYFPQTNIAAFCNTENSPELAQLAPLIEKARNKLKQLTAQRSSSSAVRRRRADLQRTVSALQTQKEVLVKRFNRFVIQHEAVHQMLFNLGVHVRGADNPLWLVEGLACQFEVPQVNQAGRLKRVNHLRLADFRDAVGVGLDVKSIKEEAYRKLLSGDRFVPLADLIGSPEPLRQRDATIAYRYAQAWALVYYLSRRYREPMTGYLRRLSTRRPGEPIGRQRELADFRAFFGEPDAEFQRTWIAYMLKLRVNRKEAGR